MATEKLGKVGYVAYNEHQGGKTYDGKPIPSWEENKRDDIKAAWDYAAESITETVIDTIEKQLGSRGYLMREVQATLDNVRQRYGAKRAARPAITSSGDSG